METAEFPPVDRLLPHEGIMVLLSRVLAHDEDATTCHVALEQLAAFEQGGRVGSWAGIEVMAQCVAVHSGLIARRQGGAPRIGLLLGSRRVYLYEEWIRGAVRVEARQNWGGENGLVSFDCTLWDAENEERIAGARLNCLLPSDAELQEIVR